MFFRRCEEIDIDGKKYIVSNGAQLDHYKCKEVIVMLWEHLKRDQTESLDKNSFTGWRKELISKLKEWDKYYMKHTKTTNPELAIIH